ncbi:hypothetical protein [Agrobacterium sp. lyk4-40-TYG-31]|uniref:hypothetical protein n=1 Tax=Agrobacterium sp. lyk4-40-TYG-31 TaxID=3040276 RepID=UPI00254BE024|nr:hypothetical protein [Agrobacterium sp. lyk4-40-TYG-31]
MSSSGEPQKIPSPKITFPSSNVKTTRMSLRGALQRAKDVYRKEGKQKLLEAIESKSLPGHADAVKTTISDECYAFEKSMSYLTHINHRYTSEELFAHSLLFGDAKYDKKLYEVVERNDTKFCFMNFEEKNLKKNSEIPIYGAGSHSKIEIDDKQKDIYFRTITTIDDYPISGFRNRRNIICELHECINVYFDIADLERLFPYSTDTPERKSKGAPKKFPDEELFETLDAFFPDLSTIPIFSVIMIMLGDFYAENYENPPGNITLRRGIKKWLSARKIDLQDKVT